MSERREIPTNSVIYPDREFLDSLYDIEEDLEKGSDAFRKLLQEILEKIIEKKLEFYIWPLQESQEELET